MLHELPAPLLDQRMSLIGIYANAIFAAKEAAMDLPQPNRFWEPRYTIENIIDTLQAVAECKPSAFALALLDSPQPKSGAQKRKPSRSRTTS
jgi:hypothetical protein